MPSAWTKHLNAYRNMHPHKPMKQCMIEASASYKKTVPVHTKPNARSCSTRAKYRTSAAPAPAPAPAPPSFFQLGDVYYTPSTANYPFLKHHKSHISDVIEKLDVGNSGFMGEAEAVRGMWHKHVKLWKDRVVEFYVCTRQDLPNMVFTKERLHEKGDDFWESFVDTLPDA